MTTPQPNQQEIREKIVITVCGWLDKLPLEITGLSMITHDHWQELYTNLEQLFQSAITEAKRELVERVRAEVIDRKTGLIVDHEDFSAFEMLRAEQRTALTKLTNEIAEEKSGDSGRDGAV